MLDLAGRLGLALLITAAYVAGLRLYTDVRLSHPGPAWACEAVFFGCLALISCTTCRRE